MRRDFSTILYGNIFVLLRDGLSKIVIGNASHLPWSFVIPKSEGVDCQYTLFQNGRHFSILLFPCKLALMASLSNAKFKRILNLERGHKGNLHGKKRILKWWPFWNKVYWTQDLVRAFELNLTNVRACSVQRKRARSNGDFFIRHCMLYQLIELCTREFKL